MKILLLKRFVARDIYFRFIGILFFAFGTVAVWIWQSQTEKPATRFLVRLPTKLTDSETIVQNRNLSDYDFGGNFSNCNGIEWTEIRKCEVAIYKARDFILNRLKGKKRGYIVYEWTGVDNGNDFHIFIEPDEYGNWHVVERSEKVYSILSKDDFRQIKSLDIRQVRRKLVTEDTDRWTPGKYYLIFLDKDGEQVGSL